MTRKAEVIILYYEQKLNIIEISNKLKVSKQYVSKIVRKDYRYSVEREERKTQNKITRIQKQKLYKQNYNKAKKENNSLEVMAVQHARASAELSGRKFLNNRAFRNWNTSIYRFHKKTCEYRVKEEFKDKVSYAVPKKIKWK